MPLHGYSTDRRPPTVFDHILAHTFEMSVAAWQVIAGGLSLLVTLFDFQISQSVQRMPQPAIAALGSFLLIGGVQCIRGLLDDSDDLMRGWTIERTGLILSGSAWLGYLVTVIAAFPASVMTWTLFVLMVAANILRYIATVLEERKHRARIEGTESDGPGSGRRARRTHPRPRWRNPLVRRSPGQPQGPSTQGVGSASDGGPVRHDHGRGLGQDQ